MKSRIMIIMGGLVVGAAAMAVVVPLLTAPKIQFDDELQAQAMEDWPEEIPEAELATMSKVVVHVPAMT